MFKKIYHEIVKNNIIIIHRHNKPDGDALGAQLGLKKAILATFPNKCVFAVGDEATSYNFVEKMDEVRDEMYKDALVIVVDSGAEKLISDVRYKLGKKIIKIDHHIPQGEYGDLVYVDTNRESCAGIIGELIMKTPLKVNSEIAKLCMLGMITDSGRFRYASTNSKTFEVASYLMKYKPDLESVYNNIYIEDIAITKLRAQMILKFEVLPCGVAYLKNTYDEVLKYNADIFTISRGMVNIMSGIKGIYVWANFTEDKEGYIYVELRSSGLNINQIAVKHGGGGHLQASGATITSWAEADEILKELEEVVKNG